MSNQISTQTVQFHNQTLITFEQNGIHYTAMKPICENIGLAWSSQSQRIKRDEVLNSTVVIITTVAEDSRNREMICLPIEYLNGWLFGIDVKRVKPEIRELLITYKKECYKALADYWLKGKAERKTTVDERTGLRDAVNMLVSKKGLIYSEAYHLVHQRFNVQSIEELTSEQLPMAVEYVHKICLEGELIINDNPKSQGIWLEDYEFYALAKASDYANHAVYRFRKLSQLFSNLESMVYYRISHNLGIASMNIATNAEKIIMRHTYQMADKNLQKEIEDHFFSNPLLKKTEPKQSLYTDF